jgi:GTP-binding protein LepA
MLMSSKTTHLCEQVGVFQPKAVNRESLSAGEVGFVISGIKELKSAKVGDTVTLVDRPASEPLVGFKEIKPQVFAGLYPVESNQYDALRAALEKLQLNDSSLHLSLKHLRHLDLVFAVAFSACYI